MVSAGPVCEGGVSEPVACRPVTGPIYAVWDRSCDSQADRSRTEHQHDQQDQQDQQDQPGDTGGLGVSVSQEQRQPPTRRASGVGIPVRKGGEDVKQYATRLAGAVRATRDDLHAIWLMLGGDGVATTLAGFNPRFDAAFLTALFAREGFTPADPWKHRLLDVAAMAYALYPQPVGAVPSLAEAADLCGVSNDRPHTAGSDVTATVEILQRLHALRDRNLA